MTTSTEKDLIDRARSLPAWHRIKIDAGDYIGARHLTAHEICLLVELFQDAREKYLRGGPIEQLGIALGVLEEADVD